MCYCRVARRKAARWWSDWRRKAMSLSVWRTRSFPLITFSLYIIQRSAYHHSSTLRVYLGYRSKWQLDDAVAWYHNFFFVPSPRPAPRGLDWIPSDIINSSATGVLFACMPGDHSSTHTFILYCWLNKYKAEMRGVLSWEADRGLFALTTQGKYPGSPAWYLYVLRDGHGSWVLRRRCSEANKCNSTIKLARWRSAALKAHFNHFTPYYCKIEKH